MEHDVRSQEAVNRNLRDRVRNLERGRPANPRPQEEEVVTYSYAGTVAAAVSPPKTVRRGGQIVAVPIAAGTAGSTSSTFKVKVAGVQVGSTLTLASSATTLNGYLGNVRVAAGSLLTVEVTPGTGLMDITVDVVMKG